MIGEGGVRALRDRLPCGGRGPRGCELCVWPRSFPFGALRFGRDAFFEVAGSCDGDIIAVAGNSEPRQLVIVLA